MNNLDLVGAIMKTAKKFAPAGPGGMPGPGAGGQGGPGAGGQGGPGAGGPPAEKKFLMMLNLMLPDQPVPLVGRICGLNPPVAMETAKGYEAKGLVVISEKDGGTFVSITDEGRALIESERNEHLKAMEEQKQKHIQECDARLADLTEEEKETLAALLAKIS